MPRRYRAAMELPSGLGYPPGATVRVLCGDHRGLSGTVTRQWADGGELVHRVRLRDGTTADYYADELVGPNGQPL